MVKKLKWNKSYDEFSYCNKQASKNQNYLYWFLLDYSKLKRETFNTFFSFLMLHIRIENFQVHISIVGKFLKKKQPKKFHPKMFHFHPFLFFILPDAKSKCRAVSYRPTSPQDGRKERVVSNRNIHSLMGGEAHTSEVRSWTNTPPCAADSRQDRARWQSSHGQVLLPVIGELTIDGIR